MLSVAPGLILAEPDAGPPETVAALKAASVAFVTLPEARDPAAGARGERIADFAAGDHIGLAGIDADSTATGNQAFDFIGGAGFHHIAGALRFAPTLGGLHPAYGGPSAIY